MKRARILTFLLIEQLLCLHLDLRDFGLWQSHLPCPRIECKPQKHDLLCWIQYRLLIVHQEAQRLQQIYSSLCLLLNKLLL